MARGMRFMQIETPLVAIVGNGEINEAALRLLPDNCPLIALDGAYPWLASRGFDVSHIIGDMDSISPEDLAHARQAGISIHKSDDQECNDFEKAVAAFSAPMMLGFGLFGGRFDHMMASLHVMAKYHHSQMIGVITNHEIISLHTGAVTLGAKPGDLVAILPLAPMMFQASKGLAYPLDGLALATGSMISSSNQATDTEIHIAPAPDDADTPFAVCRGLGLLEKSDYAALFKNHS